MGSDILAPHASSLLWHFEHCADDIRWRVAEVLSALDSSILAQHVGAVSRLLDHAAEDVRRRAVELLNALPMANLVTIAPRVLPRLEDDDEDVRLSTVELLGKLPSEVLDSPLFTAALLSRLEDEEGCVRMTAVGVLAQLPEPSQVLLAPKFMAALADDYWRVRRQAMEVLTGLPGKALQGHVQSILERMTHTDARVREWAVAACTKILGGRDAEAAEATADLALAALQPILKDEDRRVRERAQALHDALSATSAARVKAP